MGSVIKAIGGAVGDLTNTVIHTVVHTVHATVDGIEQTISVVTNAAGEATHDVVDATGKVIIKAGTKII
ncbi:MAG: hypothetical protein ACJAUL_003643 [Paraglaciecola sp.]|jgi:hypothetical protein